MQSAAAEITGERAMKTLAQGSPEFNGISSLLTKWNSALQTREYGVNQRAGNANQLPTNIDRASSHTTSFTLFRACLGHLSSLSMAYPLRMCLVCR
jgi:hypothetical protein